MTLTDDELTSQVADELDGDPRVDCSAIAVSAESGVVTLRGSVGSFVERTLAGWDATRVRASCASTTSCRWISSPSTCARTPTCAARCCRR